jgi:predicted nucleotidyltransferase
VRVSLVPAPADVRSAPRGEDGAFFAVLVRGLAALDDAGVAYGLLGGVASAALGRPRFTQDIDVFLRPGDAGRALDVLAAAGFETERTDPGWIFKATRDGILIDVIFRAKREIYFDHEMAARCRYADFQGLRVRVIAPEDLLVIKAVIHDEHTPRHWHDALGLIAAADLDWEYLARRARYGSRRVLSLLLYAQADDLPVPDSAIRMIFAATFPGDAR